MDRRPAVHDPSARRHHHVDVAAHQRLRSLDVVRGVALLGVIALNYHATLNGVEAFAPLDRTFLSRLFNPVSGVLSTRFAATYVFVAGMGVALMTSRVRTDDQDGIRHLRVKLLRRGAALLLVGYGLEWVWPGTILFYYGAYFMIASVFVVTSNRTLVVASVSSVLAAATLNVWRVSERFDDNFTAWLEPASPDSPRNVAIRLFVAYTHPVLPWIAFFFAGMIVARGVRSDRVIGSRLALGSVATVVAAYILRDAIRPALLTGQSETLRASVISLQPFDRGVLYVVSLLGIAIVSVAILVETLAPDDVTIVPISNRRDLWDEAARWSVEAWHHEFPDDTVQTYLDQYAMTQDPQGRLIEVYAAVDRRGSLRGLATLVDDDDLPDAREPGPWLAAVFVHPDARRSGIGSRLVDHVTTRAATLGHETLYLYTEHSVDWYRSKGWTIVRDTTLNGLPHVVMSRRL